MKYSLFLIVVVAVMVRDVLTAPVDETTTSSNDQQDGIGKQMDACKKKNTWKYTHNVPHETDPHKFYKCLGEYGFLITCPTQKGVPLLFNRKLLVCDWESDTFPDTPDTPDDGSTNPGSTTTKRPPAPSPDCSVEPGRKKQHPDCHKYYVCVNGKPEERSCPEGLNFDITVAECGYVDC